HSLAQFGGISIGHEIVQKWVIGFFQQVGQGIGVGGVTGLRFAGFGHIEGLEKNRLQLFWLGEIDLLATNRSKGGVLSVFYHMGESSQQAIEPLSIKTNANNGYPRQHNRKRNFEVK